MNSLTDLIGCSEAWIVTVEVIIEVDTANTSLAPQEGRCSYKVTWKRSSSSEQASISGNYQLFRCKSQPEQNYLVDIGILYMLQSVPNPKTANGFHPSNFSRCVNFPFCLKLILVMLVLGNTLELGVIFRAWFTIQILRYQYRLKFLKRKKKQGRTTVPVSGR